MAPYELPDTYDAEVAIVREWFANAALETTGGNCLAIVIPLDVRGTWVALLTTGEEPLPWDRRDFERAVKRSGWALGVYSHDPADEGSQAMQGYMLTPGWWERTRSPLVRSYLSDLRAVMEDYAPILRRLTRDD